MAVDFVAGTEALDGSTDSHHDAGEIVAGDAGAGAEQAGVETYGKGRSANAESVRDVEASGLHFDENFVR